MRKIGLDIGYSSTKVLTDRGAKWLFPSVVGQPVAMEHQGLFSSGIEDIVNHMHVRWVPEGGGGVPVEAFVGALALRESHDASYLFSQDNRIQTPEFAALLASALAMGVPPQGDEGIHVATGLPLDYFAEGRAFLKDLLETFRGHLEWKSGKQILESRAINVQKATLFPQSGAALYDTLFNPDGQFRSPQFEETGFRYAMIDVGFGTTDIVVVEVADRIRVIHQLSRTLPYGISRVHKAVQDGFFTEHHTTLPTERMEQVIQKKTAIFRGDTLDVSHIVNHAVETVAKAIYNRVLMQWGQDEASLHTVFACGGGAELLQEALSQSFSRPIALVPHAQWANARGYLSLAMMHQHVS